MKIGVLFAGQGSQYVGLGQELVKSSSIAADIYRDASVILGYNLLEISNSELVNDTKYTQPAVLTFNYALAKLLMTQGINVDCVAGLSLGEYNALLMADVLSFKQALNIVAMRATIMSEAILKNSTKMAAVLKADIQVVEKVLADEQFIGKVAICNYNTLDQVVIGGLTNELMSAIEQLKENNQKRIVLLDVSIVSHMSLLNNASEQLKQVLSVEVYNEPSCHFINNISGNYQTSDFVSSLANQISKPTYMAKTIELMIKDGVDTFIEIAPKATVASFVKSIAKVYKKNVKIIKVNDITSLEGLVEEVKR